VGTGTAAASASRRTATEAQPYPGRPAKRAARVADRIIDDIAARGWPEGEIVGSEPELRARYGVSRAVFREAVRLVEHQQVARMRRGPGGGLVVTSPTVEAVIDPVAVSLFYANARVAQVAEARITLEQTVADLVPGRLTEDDVARLRDLAERERTRQTNDHRELHALLATMTKNPALELFVSLLNRLTHLYFPDVSGVSPAVSAEVRRAHQAIIKAVIAGDAGLARHRMRTHLEAEAVYIRRRVKPGQLLDTSVLRSLDERDKRGERVARALLVEVAGSGWPVGEVLGSEAELMARFDVSRAVLREAARLLEHHQIAAMRRGPGGGLVVTRPGIDSAADAIALLLERRGIRPGDVFEVRTAVDRAVVELAVERMDERGEVRLREALARERDTPRREFPVAAHDFHAVLASLVHNPVFELLSLCLLRLTRMHQVPRGDPADLPSAEVLRVHTAIADAVIGRDVELALHRTRRHLEEINAWLR
jgi:DNA-binding FadR family transcriptional regulator